jgi:ABC-type branched-subunit amino acid transport system ATPase component
MPIQLQTGVAVGLAQTTESEVVLQAEHLRKSFGGQVVLDGVCLELRRGQVALLQGDNGSGKSTLLNMLTGQLEPDAGTIAVTTDRGQAEFQFPLSWQQRLNLFGYFTPERLAGLGIGRMWQDVRLFLKQSLRDNVAVATPQQIGENPVRSLFQPVAVRKQSRRNDKTAVARLESLGLVGRENSVAEGVSLGQSKRVAIARTLQAGSEILFLDEPLAGLDAAGITEVMDALAQLVREVGLTLVIVEHVFNIPRVLELATTVWTLEGGKLRVDSPEWAKSQVERSATDGMRGWLEELAGTEGKIEDRWLAGGALLTTVTPAGGVGEVVLEVEDLVVYRGRRLVVGVQGDDGVKGLSFVLRRGELAVLQAPNGWGKTTLLEAIAGSLPIAAGEIKVNGRSVRKFESWQRVRSGMALLQSQNNVFAGLQVREGLRLAKVREVPAELRCFLGRRVSELSGGERQRVAISCAIRGRPFAVGLLDEPFSALDPKAVEQLRSLQLEQLERVGWLVSVPMGAATIP